jgi:hypothetical protein
MGLCNRTRLLITRLADYVLEVTDMTSSSSGINKQTFSLGLNKHIGTSRAMRNNTKRGDCKEQQLCMEFIDSKKSFTKRDIRKNQKSMHVGQAPRTPSIRARMPTAQQTYIYHTALHAPTTTLSDQLNCTA